LVLVSLRTVNCQIELGTLCFVLCILYFVLRSLLSNSTKKNNLQRTKHKVPSTKYTLASANY